MSHVDTTGREPEGHAADQFEHTVEEHADGPDMLTVYPADCDDDDDLMTHWITSDAWLTLEAAR